MKTNISNRRITWRALRYALTNQLNRSFYGAIFFFVAIAAACMYFGYLLFGGALALFAIVAFGLLVGTSLIQYNTAESLNKMAMLKNWVREADTEAERAKRLAVFQSGNFDDAWLASSLTYDGPRFNTDGTPMLPGNAFLDINGSIYGASEMGSAVFNENTGGWTDPATAYGNPLSGVNGGMDLSSGGMGAGGMSSSSSDGFSMH